MAVIVTHTKTLVAPDTGVEDKVYGSDYVSPTSHTIAGVGTLATVSNLTGPITSTGAATAVASQTGTGSKFVMDTSPTLVTPALGTPASGVLTNCTGLPLAGNGTIANIQGLGFLYNSATVFTVKAGSCAINGKWLALAQTDYTSASTMKDLSNATVTLAASKAYNVYAHDNAGTLQVRFESATGSGNGNDPDFTNTYDYWESVLGPTDRRIGKFWTDGSANIIPFNQTVFGRHRIYNINDCEVIALVNGVAQASYTSITVTPYINSDDAELLIGIGAFATGVNTAAGIRISTDGGTGQSGVFYITASATGLGMSDMKLTLNNNGGSLKYLTISSANGYVFLMGYSQFV